MNTQAHQEEVNERLDGLLNDVMGTLQGAGPVEIIAVGTALILIGMESAKDSEKSAAWQKLRDFLATTTKH